MDRTCLTIFRYSEFERSLANPQKEALQKWALKEGKVVVALDLSNSMLAQDLAPNRLVQAKEFIKDL